MLRAETLGESIRRLRAIPARWKHLDNPIGELDRMRRDFNYSPWANPKWAVPFVPCCATCDCDVPTRAESSPRT